MKHHPHAKQVYTPYLSSILEKLGSKESDILCRLRDAERYRLSAGQLVATSGQSVAELRHTLHRLEQLGLVQKSAPTEASEAVYYTLRQELRP